MSAYINIKLTVPNGYISKSLKRLVLRAERLLFLSPKGNKQPVKGCCNYDPPKPSSVCILIESIEYKGMAR